MRVQVLDAGIKFGNQNQRLAETPRAVAGEVAAQVADKGAPCMAVAGPARHLAPGAQHPQRLAVQIFRQVARHRADFFVQRMARAVGGAAQGVNAHIQPALLQRVNLARDKRLRQARVALQDKSNGAHRPHPPTGNGAGAGPGAVVL